MLCERKGQIEFAPDSSVPHDEQAVAFHQLPPFTTPPYCPQTTAIHAELQRVLSGKQLLLSELPYSLQTLHEQYQRGCIAFEQSIRQHGPRHFQCLRCGNEQFLLFAKLTCFQCKEHDCVYCRKCLMMGRVAQCMPLLRWIGPPFPYPSIKQALQWQGKLTPAQQKASDHLRSLVSTGGELLLWAVCGAGKTEVLFSGIARALELQQRICLASPRKDVILELLPRFQAAFPTVTIAGLYGGCKAQEENAQLILATTHQLFRFKEAFDLLIIDEVDAFPYSYDETLEKAVYKAKKQAALLVYLSATPSRALQRKAEQKKMNAIYIPLRYHGHPLPLPRFQWCGHWKRLLYKKKLPKPLQHWLIKQLESGRQAFLFVPSVTVLQEIVPLLKSIDSTIEGVFAEDPHRHEKVMAFRNGAIKVIVTTTILERGVTIPFTDVAVLGAEEKIFCESALVQIAGRAGRSSEDPSGDVCFFHYGKSNAMQSAQYHLIKMNQRGRHLT
ncbi:helicase domain-containing protein [Fictibacillus macauensis ZFHKF-1]|uniref:Helicase domain-containing protein n=1 Tax=Fictibacillus macauensis ZFHKF-1 TaxID=1196324 RepID=I8UJ68_9BACL|nr:helicase domain-containing protein [Fictibacillus macauensis ZFHKF-1]